MPASDRNPNDTSRADGTLPAAISAAAWQAAEEASIVSRATGLDLLAVEGADAETFLQGQLSNDVRSLAPGRGQWTSYNSPKGRMLATMFLYRPHAAAGYRALVAADLVQSVAKRLSMFVLRAKVKLSMPGEEACLFGVGGPKAAPAIEAAFGITPGRGQIADHEGTSLVHLPDGRFVVVAHADMADTVHEALSRHATSATAAVWDWLGVRSGIPMVTAATQDKFVAQTANWDLVGGLDFHKGCYTGQEIVARTQYLGRLKERLYAFTTAAAPPTPGTRLYAAAFGDQACGTVVNSALGPDDRAWFLAVAQIEAADTGTMAIGTPEGPPAVREALPYALPEPTAPRGRMAP